MSNNNQTVYVVALQSFNYKDSGEVVEVHSSTLGVYSTRDAAWASVATGMEATKAAVGYGKPSCTNDTYMFRQVKIIDSENRQWIYQWTVQPFTVQ